MAALNFLECDDSIEFTRLRLTVNATGGNLAAHLETLKRARYIAVEKSFVGRRPQTRIRATSAGRSAYPALRLFCGTSLPEILRKSVRNRKPEARNDCPSTPDEVRV